MDSLKVLNNAFIVSKDTIGIGFNQVKGQNLYGKFKDKSLDNVDIIKNTEVIYYMRNDKQELIGINSLRPLTEFNSEHMPFNYFHLMSDGGFLGSHVDHSSVGYDNVHVLNCIFYIFSRPLVFQLSTFGT